MKKVAFITPTYPVLSETFIQTEVDALHACGHQVCVMTFEKEPSKIEFDYDVEEIGCALDWHVLSLFKVPNVIHAVSFVCSQSSLPKRSLLYYGAQLALQLSKQGVTHAHAHFCQHTTAHAIVASKLLGIGCSFVGHGHDVYESAFDIDQKLRFSDFSVAVCRDMYHDFQRTFPSNIKYLHCGVKLDQIPHLERKQSDGLHLVFVGRLVETKGVHFLLQALAELLSAKRTRRTSIRLDIIGTGEQQSQLQQLTKQLNLGDSVRFLGAKPHQQVLEALQTYDCLVAPFCFSDSGCVDTGPLVLKEAMASGTPVITSNIMGCKEIVVPGTGYLVDEKDASQLAQAIEQFSQLTSKQRTLMGRAARQHVINNFDAFKQARCLSDWIEQVSSS
ncbi:glycosyltransferase family 4 protein [Vibrio sp. SCSIO 43135]|uniref:glycosyltransferase family 4 protein n=1 Tax=Vibrio sp. SCSIO 43135 TaxID=2819096 RepID=UPI0020759925|nr:glycosyltransferase family 4 protein [Vibrio sp. SCSIO 43135]USD43543.1 glycosyltransferase family 4 protein [Vibrio sp. SCSIO 43135]